MRARTPTVSGPAEPSASPNGGRPGQSIAGKAVERSLPVVPDADAGDARSLLSTVRALVRRFSISERADVACCGVTVAQAATVEVLRTEGPLRLGSLGRRLGITPSTLTRNVDRLERAGLVTRVADPDDQRAARLGLTAAGRRAAAALERQEEAFARQVLDRLPAERRPAVVEALADLLGAVRGATEACCPGAFDHLMAGFPQASACKTRGNDEDHGCRDGCR